MCLGWALVAVWEHPKGVYILYNGLDVVHHTKAKFAHQVQQCHADVHSEEWLPSIGTPEPAHVACPVIAINFDWTMGCSIVVGTEHCVQTGNQDMLSWSIIAL